MDQPDTTELNAIYRPLFQSWLDEHGARPTCPVCESPDYLLTARFLPFAAPELDDTWRIYIRLCRRCRHMLQFDIGRQLDAAIGGQPPVADPQSG